MTLDSEFYTVEFEVYTTDTDVNHGIYSNSERVFTMLLQMAIFALCSIKINVKVTVSLEWLPALLGYLILFLQVLSKDQLIY